MQTKKYIGDFKKQNVNAITLGFVSFPHKLQKTYNEAAEHNQRLSNLSTSGNYIILREQQSYLNIQHDNLAADRL